MKKRVKKAKFYDEDIEIVISEIRPNIFSIDENHWSTGYLIVGKEKALMIDTMSGLHNLKETIEELTDKPYEIINTHGHPDHIFGNIFFDKALISKKDIPIAQEHTKSNNFEKVCKAFNSKMSKFEYVKEGDTINLGERTVKIYEVPGHTPGELVLLLVEDRILFVGDAINHHQWAMLPESLSLEQYVEELDRIGFLEKEADIIYHGHSYDYDDISLIREMKKGIKEILEGKRDTDEEYVWFGGTSIRHNYEIKSGKHFQQNDHAVIYRKDNIYKDK